MFLAELAYPVTIAPALTAAILKETKEKKTSLNALALSHLAFVIIAASAVSEIPKVYAASPLRKWVTARTLQGFYALMIVVPGLLIQALASYILLKNNQDTSLLTKIEERYNVVQERNLATKLSYKEWMIIVFKTLVFPVSQQNLAALAFSKIHSSVRSTPSPYPIKTYCEELLDNLRGAMFHASYPPALAELGELIKKVQLAHANIVQLIALFEKKREEFLKKNSNNFDLQSALTESENTELKKDLIRVIIADLILDFHNGEIIDTTRIKLNGYEYDFTRYAFDTKFFADIANLTVSDLKKLTSIDFTAEFSNPTLTQLQYLLLRIKLALFSEESFTEKEKQALLAIQRIRAFHDTWEEVWYGNENRAVH